MCTKKDHEIGAYLLLGGLFYSSHYNGDFECSNCNEVILSIRDGEVVYPFFSKEEFNVK